MRNHPFPEETPLQKSAALLHFARRRLREERLPQVAASLTFTTVLALVPLLIIALAVFTTFPLFGTLRASLESYFLRSLMPPGISGNILGYLNQFAAKANRLSAIGAVGLILSATAMMLTIDRAFNQIWRVKFTRPPTQRIVVYWAVITLGPLLIGVSITLTSYVFRATNGIVGDEGLLGPWSSTVISLILTTVAFTLLYMIVPYRRVEWRDAACGALFAAIAFEVAKRAFAVFIAQFPAYTVLYGTLAAMPIFLIWIFLSWLIVLMGAVFAAAMPVVKYERWWHVPTPGSAFVDAMEVLRVLFEAREHSISAAVDANAIRDQTRLGFDESESLLEQMYAVGWVGRVKTEAPGRFLLRGRATESADRWTLLVSPAKLLVADVYRLFAFHASVAAGHAAQVEKTIESGLGQPLSEYFGNAARAHPPARTAAGRPASAST